MQLSHRGWLFTTEAVCLLMLVGELPVVESKVPSEAWCERDGLLHQNFKIMGGLWEEIMKYHVLALTCTTIFPGAETRPVAGQ